LLQPFLCLLNMKKINFYSGPAILPEEVLEQAKAAIQDFAGTGLSILEISHRSKEFVRVMEEARELVKELMRLDPDKEVLFLQGGASSQFYMIPMNLLNENETASYLDTGNWAHNAIAEAKNFGHIHVVCSSKNQNYTHIPKQYEWVDSKYVHLTTNNTIYGTQFPIAQLNELKREWSLVADMSSDIFSREIDYNKYDLIYAGAQKNMGPAGTTLVVVNKNILGKVNRVLPKMIDYRVHIEKDSMYNTPSVFAVYVSWLMLKWIKEKGLKKIAATNQQKAEKLYAAIDKSSIFEGTVATCDRSQMNVCFRVKSELDKTIIEERFLQYATAQNIVGIKGYRTVGGFRASIYNAMSEKGVDALVQAMAEFERTH
jgi:phosphoserine aminotransferase